MLKQLQRDQRGQSTAEYAIVIALVLGAVIGMQTYVRRALQGRVEDASNSHLPNAQSPDSGPGTNAGADPMFPANWSKFSRTQFEPYYASSTSDSTTVVDTLSPAGGVGNIEVRGTVGDASAVKGGFQSVTDRDSDSAESAPLN